MATLIAPNGGVVVVPDTVADDYLRQGYVSPGSEPEVEPKRARKSKSD